MSHLNLGLICGGIFCDLTKAFDCVDHRILINKLDFYGIRGNALALLKSYLTNRCQYVEISDHSSKYPSRSDEMYVKVGVPQGSVLGPLLFLIFINDLPDVINLGTPYLYADDTSIILNASTSIDLCKYMQESWTQLLTWFAANGLKMNCSKSFYMTFRRSTSSPDFDCNIPICKAKCTTFLGVDLDPYLRWNNQIDKVNKKLAGACFAMKSLMNIASKEVLLTMYFSYFESIIRYCIEVWGNGTNINSVLLKQKKALRLIQKCASVPDSHRSIFVDNKILTVISLYLYRLCIYVFNNKNQYHQQGMTKNHNLRQRNRLNLNDVHYVHFDKSLNNTAIRVYNLLPDDMKNIKDLKLFDKKVKEYFLTRPFYSINEYYTNFFDKICT